MTEAQELSLFDFGVKDTTKPAEEKKKEEKKGAAAKTNSVAAAKKPKEQDTLLVTGEWTIHLATEAFTVADFVDEIPEEGVLLDVVREGMERSFNQYTKARTKWDIDKENKRLFPDAFAGSKGATTSDRLAPALFSRIEDARNSNSVNRYLIDQEGNYYRFHSSVFGEMVVKTNENPASPVNEQFEWQLPKIPSAMFGQIIGFFKYFAGNVKKPLEVAVRVYWDLEEQQFVLECPNQIVSPVRIDLKYGEQFIGRNSLRYIPVLEMHSHNVMRAFFSDVDDADEQAYCVYGVLGRLDRDNIEMCFRAKCGDNFIPLNATAIFDLSNSPESFSFPSEWLENVKESKGWFK